MSIDSNILCKNWQSIAFRRVEVWEKCAYLLWNPSEIRLHHYFYRACSSHSSVYVYLGELCQHWVHRGITRLMSISIHKYVNLILYIVTVVVGCVFNCAYICVKHTPWMCHTGVGLPYLPRVNKQLSPIPTECSHLHLHPRPPVGTSCAVWI